jgi:hypothetical protein
LARGRVAHDQASRCPPASDPL